jgi:glycosyltransferase involved in cell wall biosynthesis
MEFLRMAKTVMKKNETVRFTMAGRIVDKKFYEELMEFREREGLTRRVKIPGPLYGKDKQDLLQSADIFVFPTEKDTFPLVNIEAMQFGLPVVSSNQGVIPDIIRDGLMGT